MADPNPSLLAYPPKARLVSCACSRRSLFFAGSRHRIQIRRHLGIHRWGGAAESLAVYTIERIVGGRAHLSDLINGAIEALIAAHYELPALSTLRRERFYIQYALLEIQEAIENTVAGVRPRRRQWGVVSARYFLHILEDVTTWSLTHFETVRSWSLAEDMTSIEIANGLKLIGRHRRMTPDDYAGDHATRSLVDIEDPAVRGSALWFAHSVMASFHQDASDRQTAYRRTSRQAIKYAASPPGAVWLASRMSTWPERYRRKCWLNLRS